MSSLSPRDRELVALGAALGSNCVPCVEHHIPESRKAGLTDEEIRAAIQHADTIRRVPARKTLEVALSKLAPAPGDAPSPGAGPGGGCGAGAPAAGAGDRAAAWPIDAMVEIMSRMMATRCGPPADAGTPKASEEATAVGPAAGDTCGCASQGV